MLNELMLVRRTLTQIGISTKPRHRDLAMLGKGGAVLRIILKSDGKVGAIETIPRDTAPIHWTFRDGKQNSFPRISFKPALHGSLPDADKLQLTDKRKTLSERSTLLLSLIQKHPSVISSLIPWISISHRERIRQRGEEVMKSSDKRAHLFSELTSAFLKTSDEDLLNDIDTKLVEKLINAPTDDLLNLAIRLYFLDETSTKKSPGACDLLFDFESPVDFKRASDPVMIGIISDSITSDQEEKIDGKCSLTGNPAQIENNKFLEANLPLLGPTQLYSRNRDIPSAARYRAAGPMAMKVSRSLISELQAASEELASKERNGKTWTSIPSEKPKQSDLLLCYIPAAPDEEVASAFSMSEGAFEKLGERITELSKGKSVVLPENAQIEICILRKIDKANKKAIYSGSLSVNSFQEASAKWKRACESGPAFSMVLPPPKRGEKTGEAKPRTLVPGRIVQLSRSVYIRNGTESVQATGIPFAKAFSLIMHPQGGNRVFKLHLLHLFLTRGGPLLIAVGRARNRVFKPDIESIKPESRRDAVDLSALLAAILFQMQIHQNDTMNSPAYKLGQLLSGADILHRGYCLDVRKGSLPPNLIGNAALVAAGRNPTTALSQLLRRWTPYHGWATRKRRDDASLKQQIMTAEVKGEKTKASEFRMIREGTWATKNLSSLANDLKEPQNLPNRPDDVFRSQLLLGYLAGLPRPEQKQ